MIYFAPKAFLDMTFPRHKIQLVFERSAAVIKQDTSDFDREQRGAKVVLRTYSSAWMNKKNRFPVYKARNAELASPVRTFLHDVSGFTIEQLE